MPRLTKIYTRKGDDGTTALGSLTRVSKDATRVKAYGDVDELNSALGSAIAMGLDSKIAEALVTIQNELFHLGAVLSFPENERERFQIPLIRSEHIDKLEQLTDELMEIVGPIENFILPGGSKGGAQLHIARAVCRRAERSAVSLSLEEEVGDNVLAYLKRLSDALFAMARYENHMAGVSEQLWDSHA
jgi:cob(I)alamin adenosyltransferase